MGRRQGHAGAAVLLAACMLCSTGCERRFFHTAGRISSDGGELGTWRMRPVSCTRDAANGFPGRDGEAIATLLWADPSRRDKRYINQGQKTAPEVPMRLDLMRVGGGVTGVLDMWRRKGVRLDARVCTQLEMTTQEGAAALPEGRPTLTGHLVMDCTVEGSHLAADLTFNGCEY